MRHRHLRAQARVAPEEWTLMQTTCALPDSDAIMHVDLHAISPSVGEQVASLPVAEKSRRRGRTAGWRGGFARAQADRQGAG